MIRYIFQRLLAMLGVLLGISLIAFSLATIAPGDPAQMLLQLQKGGDTPTAAEVSAFRTQLGLDAPAPQRYVRWLMRLLRGDLGISYRTGQSILAEIGARMPATIVLALVSLLIAMGVGLPLGILAAVRQGTWLDALCRLLALIGATIPSYLLSLLLIYLFAVVLGWLPSFGYGTPRHLVLPAIALSASIAPRLMRLTRAGLLEVLGQDYIRTAHMKGLPVGHVLWVHALKNTWLPIVTAIALSMGGLLSGAVIVETIFSWYGIGKYVVDAIAVRDYPVIQGVTLYMTVMVVGINFMADLCCLWLDPRVER